MDLYFFNTLTRRKEVFKPLQANKVSLYVCGPTVYDRAHLGNARPYVVFDVLVRLLHYLAYDVTYVRNITDIDDKIILAARLQQRSIEDITTQTTRYFHEAMAALGVRPPTYEPRATAYVAEMIAFIEKLLTNGFAYIAEGHVLFEVAKHSDYGCLSRCHQEEMVAGARVEVAPYKKHPADFVLWKPSTPDMPGWDSPWGRGRPGWHIECSTMSYHLLGEKFDIHAGGQDLIFPHHENEIAQSTAAFGKGTFAHTWLHNGILTVNGEKMSKSLGNFVTVEELLAQAAGETIRFAILSTHYRQPLDWTTESLLQAKTNLDRFYTALRDEEVNPSAASVHSLATSGDSPAASVDSEVLAALKDDLNTPAAIARLHELVHRIHTATHLAEKKQWQACLRHSGGLMGLLQKSVQEWFQGTTSGQFSLTAEDIEKVIQARQQARQRRDFAQADALRQQLLEKGVILEDTPQGTSWRRA